MVYSVSDPLYTGSSDFKDFSHAIDSKPTCLLIDLVAKVSILSEAKYMYKKHFAHHHSVTSTIHHKLD